MKKKSFLSGIGAKLALAAVALTTVVFTSCEKEEFNVEPVELPNASATVVVTVYDLATGNIISDLSKTETLQPLLMVLLLQQPKHMKLLKKVIFQVQ